MLSSGASQARDQTCIFCGSCFAGSSVPLSHPGSLVSVVLVKFSIIIAGFSIFFFFLLFFGRDHYVQPTLKVKIIKLYLLQGGEYLHMLFEFTLRKICLFSFICLFNYFSISIWIHVYCFILWVIIQYYLFSCPHFPALAIEISFRHVPVAF